jgi:hypothetical protein
MASTVAHSHFGPRTWLAGRRLRSMSAASLRMPSATTVMVSSLRVRSLRSLLLSSSDHDILRTRQGSLMGCTLSGLWPLWCENKHGRRVSRRNAATVAPTLAVAVVACRLVLAGCRGFAACSPPVGGRCIRTDFEDPGAPWCEEPGCALWVAGARPVDTLVLWRYYVVRNDLGTVMVDALAEGRAHRTGAAAWVTELAGVPRRLPP